MEEFILPFYEEQNKNKAISMSGSYVAGLPTDYSEADWEKLKKIIRKKFSSRIAKRNVLNARVEWYNRLGNAEKRMHYGLLRLDQFPEAITDHVLTNMICWDGFLQVTNKKILYECIESMKKLVALKPWGNYIDTYANLLYKIGKKEEAIEWEQKAISTAIKDGQPKFEIDEYRAALEQMKKGESTYSVQPLK